MKRTFAVLVALSVAACEYDVRTVDRSEEDRSVFSPPPSEPPSDPPPARGPGYVPSNSPEQDASAGDGSAAPSTPTPTQCEGVATSCAQLDLFMCGQQAGCGIDGDECGGAATPCEDISKMYACGQQSGCSWIPK